MCQGFRATIVKSHRWWGKGLINELEGQWLSSRWWTPYYRTRATPYNARRTSCFLSLFYFFFLLLFSFLRSGRIADRWQCSGVVAPSPPLRRERFLMTVILEQKEGKGERERERESRLKRERLTLRDWDWGGKQSDSRFQGGCAHQRPLKVVAQCARTPISALSRSSFALSFSSVIFIFSISLSLIQSIPFMSFEFLSSSYLISITPYMQLFISYQSTSNLLVQTLFIHLCLNWQTITM